MTLRILYVIETLGHGGAEHQLVATVRRLDRARFEPIVCHLRGPDYLASQLRDVGIAVHCLEVPAGKHHWPEVVLKLRALVRDTRADLIHTSLFQADVLGGLAGKLANVPVISTLCNIAGERVRLADNPRNNWLKFGVANWMWGGALRSLHQHSIAISHAVLDSAVQTFHMDPSRISVIYRGIDDGKVPSITGAAEVRRRIGLPDATPLLLSIGRLAPQKGHKHLIAALPTLLTSFPQAKLAIVGEGWLRPQLEAQARELGIADSVRFLGKRTDVTDLLAACDMFVFPSLFEGLGVSLLEASYAGCACISTNTGPIPEIIEHGETGMLVPPGDSKALGQALLKLANDPEFARRLGRAAQESTSRRFMLADKVADLERCYASLFSPREASP